MTTPEPQPEVIVNPYQANRGHDYGLRDELFNLQRTIFLSRVGGAGLFLFGSVFSIATIAVLLGTHLQNTGGIGLFCTFIMLTIACLSSSYALVWRGRRATWAFHYLLAEHIEEESRIGHEQIAKMRQFMQQFQHQSDLYKLLNASDTDTISPPPQV